MKNKLFKILFCITLLNSNLIRSQDFHLSLYDAAPMFLNPALTGVVDSKFRVHAQYKNQWKIVSFKPYNHSLISLN